MPSAAGESPPNADGTELTLASAGGVEQLTRARGTLFLVTDRHGDIAPRGAKELGLFYEDTRYLSHYELGVVGAAMVYLSAETADDAFNQIDLMLSGLEDKELLDDPQNYLHIRRRQLVEQDFLESIAFTNFLTRKVSLDVRFAFDVDFADVFEVRGAHRPRRGHAESPDATGGNGPGVDFRYVGLDGVRRASRVTFAPAPTTVGPREVRYTLDILPGETKTLSIRVTPRRLETSAPRRFDAAAKRLVDEAAEFRDASTKFRCDSELVQQLLDQAVTDLHALRIQFGDHRVVGAGIPWFCCPFGRDSLLASYEALMLNPALAIETLQTLGAYQGKRYDDRTEEEPGKIFHELRFGEMAGTGEIPHSPYFGSIDATPLFVVLAEAALATTGDLPVAGALRDSVVGALEWIDRRSEGGTRFVTYEKKTARGLDNQGWKDSRAGVCYPDGRPASPPIALCEVQGYCYDAYARGARLLASLGETALASTYRARAEIFRQRFESEFWLPAARRYAYAIDGRGGKLDTVVSNLGHLLWSRIVDEDRARSTTDLLTHPDSFSGFGVRTLASGQAVYNPLSYHNGTVWPHDNALVAQGMAQYRLTAHAARVFDGILAAASHFRDRRLPELYCGLPRAGGSLVRYPVACSPQAWASAAPFLLLQAVLGIEADAANGRLAIVDPMLPASIQRLEIDDLRVGDARVSIRFERAGTGCRVERLDVRGGPLRTEVVIY